MSVRRSVWFHRGSAIVWIVLGTVGLMLGWGNSVFAVWIASVYANAKTDWSTAAAQDDGPVLQAIAELREEVRAHVCHCEQSLQRQGRGDV